MIFAIAIGLCAGLLGYSFGSGNHIEQIPLILKAHDSSKFLNDFFVNASFELSPRLYYANFIAFFIKFSSIESTFLVLTILVHVLTAIGGYLLLKTVSIRNNVGILGGYIFIVLVLFVIGFDPGGATMLTSDILIPQTISIAVAITGIVLLIRSKIVPALIALLISSAFHPLIGAESVLLFFCAYIASHNIHLFNKKEIIHIMIGFTIFILGYLFLWGEFIFQGSKLEYDLYSFLVIDYRHPHHYLKDFFPAKELHNLFIYSVLAIISLLLMLNKGEILKKVFNFLTSLIIVTLVFIYATDWCINNLEIRACVSLQPWRMAFILKLVSYVGISMLVASEVYSKNFARIFASVCLIVTLINSPVSSLIISIIIAIMIIIKSPLIKKLAIVFIGFIFLQNILYPSYDEPNVIIFYIFLCIAFAAAVVRVKLIKLVLLSTLFIFAIGLLNNWKMLDTFPGKIRSELYKKYPMQVITDTYPKSVISAAQMVQQFTLPDDVILTPPNYGEIRILANRSIVVDFKSFPFSDSAMQEWHNRMSCIYGLSDKKGFIGLEELDENYKNITDSHLKQLSIKYKFSYALLYSSTETTFQVLSDNKSLKLVRVPK